MPHGHGLRLALVFVFAQLVAHVSSASAQVTYEVVTTLGGSARGGVIKGTDGAFYGTADDTQCGTVYKVLADGTLTVLHEFQGHFATPPDGCHPRGELVEGADGNFYGTTMEGGPNADAIWTSGTGTIFKISPDGVTYSIVHPFALLDSTLTYHLEGAVPIAGLTLGLDGNFYGTTSYGGAGSIGGTDYCNPAGFAGTFFELTPAGALTVQHAFVPAEGCAPTNLTLTSDGNFVGATSVAAVAGNPPQPFGGTVFKITPAGSFTKLFSFPTGAVSGSSPYGTSPQSAPVEASDGNLYGTTSAGGPTSDGTDVGTVYKLSPVNEIVLLHGFTGSDGASPFAGVTIGSDGFLYGATSAGGAFSNGTLFQIGTSGTLTTPPLYSFEGPNDGAAPLGRLLETSPGVFYGTTSGGGSGGLVFRFTTLQSISVTPVAPSLPKGLTLPFTATGTFTDGSTRDITGSVTWTSSKTTIATIGGGGLALGVAKGTTTIKATSGSISGSTALTVTAPVLAVINVTPVNPTIVTGTTKQFVAKGTYSDGSVKTITNTVTWTSSSTSVATIGITGLATGVGVGASTITATLGSMSGATTLTVQPALVSIAIAPINPSIAVGMTQQFTATGTFSDNSIQDLTSSVVWISSKPGVATINASGLATAVTKGSTRIKAKLGPVIRTTTLTVTP